MLSENEFQSICKVFFTGTMTFVCSAVVPEVVSKKYFNHMLAEKIPYSIYQMNSNNTSYLLIFRFKDIINCRTIQLTDMHNLNCPNNENEPKSYNFSYSYCLFYNYTMELTSDLTSHCGADAVQRNLESGYFFMSLDNDHDTSIKRNVGDRLGSHGLVLCLIISFLLIAILQWKAHRL
ncbi:uncharacterized protein LOC108112397 [Drosophila eugracilis]|uniref:uncharacterized protein LOC108112397 n=1 Tax=Drosophila eugracilis TaxID=29029 RepID=UPI001BD974E2|nr:uncharacterized protein LOC108112397 [Drosophila eugracilis]